MSIHPDNLAAIGFALSITLPNLLLMGLGFFMRMQQQINDDFIHYGSFLVFNYCLPCLLFFSIINSEVNIAEQLRLISAGVLVTFILYVGAELYAKRFVTKARDKGVFVQGVFRSNMAIIGLSTVHNAYGAQGLGIGAVYMGVVTILFNVLAVITLSRETDQQPVHGQDGQSHQVTVAMLSQSPKLASKFTTRLVPVGKKLIKNPLILSLVSAFIYKIMEFPHPHAIIEHTSQLLANVSLPLALICAGASINIKAMLQPSGDSMKASLGRIIIAPITAIVVGYAFGLPMADGRIPASEPTLSIQMGVLFLMVSAPTASASFIMAKAMGGNEQLAANILAFTTVFSMIGMGVGSGVLRAVGWM